MQEKLIEAIRLENDLTVKVWDKSRTLAGDRCLVCLEARLDVPLENGRFDGAPQDEKAVEVLKEICGPALSYRYCQKKHFVDRMKKEEVLRDFLAAFKKDVVPYLSRPDFSRKLLWSKQREIRAKRPDLFMGGPANSP